MNQSDRFALPLLEAGQAQKEITHNEAVLAVDRLLHLSVAARTLAAPPASPAAGAAWIVAAAATGAWSGHGGSVATWDGAGWSFRAPATGMLAWIDAEGGFAVYRSGAWSGAGWPVASATGGRTLFTAAPVAVAAPAGGTVVDVEARAALAAVLTALRGQGVIV